MPTPKGYRFFVDTLMVVKPLEQVEINRLEGELTADRPQQIVNAAASAPVAAHAFRRRRDDAATARAVVPSSRIPAPVRPPRAPDRRDAGRRRAEPHPAHRPCPTRSRSSSRRPTSSTRISRASRFPRSASCSPTSCTSLRDDIGGLMAGGGRRRRARALREGEALVVTGERNLLTAHDLASNMERLRQLFDLFEQKTSLLHLLDISQRRRACRSTSAASRAWRRSTSERRHRAVRSRRPRDRHARRHRPDADGVRARDPDRRPDGEAAVQRAFAAAFRTSEWPHATTPTRS